VPTIVQYELARCLTREVSEDAADDTIAFSTECVVTSLSTRLAIQAAEIAKDHALAMADAIIYATAVDAGADLLTCAAHFAKLPRVVYVAKGPQ
jgi:predicted nucleic acid-binding protein